MVDYKKGDAYMTVKNKKRLKLLMTGFLLSIIMSLAIGCGSDTSSSVETESKNDTSTSKETTAKEESAPQQGGTITVAFSDEPDQLDVHKSGMAVANIIAGNLGGGLVTQDPETLDFEPYLAEEWDVSEDGKTWTFKIRSGVTFHDGTPLTAQSFVETYQRALDPDTASKVAGSNLSTIESVSASDDQTLVLKLKEPFAPLLQYLSDPGWLQPLSMAAIEKYGDQYGRNPVGVGPWKFESWETGQAITLVRNEEFKWAEPFFDNQGAAKADKLVFRFITENQTKLAALESGSIDIAAKVEAKDAKRYRNSDQFEVHEQLRNGLGLFMIMNTQSEELQDVTVRKAVNMAVNKDAIIKAVIQGEGLPAYGPLPPTFFGYDPSVEEYGYQYNLEQAKKHLEQAGWSLNSDGFMAKNGEVLSLDLLTMEGTWSKAAQLTQAMLKEVGIEVNIVMLEWGALLENATNGNFDMTLMGYTFNDPDVLYLFLHSSQADGGLNLGDVRDEKLDNLLDKGRTTVESSARKEIYAELQKYIIDQAWWVPIYTEKQFYVVNKRVKEISIHPFRGLLYHDSWVGE
jgi:peptide/nickel transport system substrate-binding protein